MGPEGGQQKGEYQQQLLIASQRAHPQGAILDEHCHVEDRYGGKGRQRNFSNHKA
jgi:hypothetical protein